jgi:Uma2 family endonuclease
VLLRRKEGGTAHVDGSYLAGPPELIAEIASSSASIDLHAKLNAYRRNGVQEYIVWRVRDGEIDWFSLEGGAYARMPADERGVVHSKVFPGLRLAVAAMLAGDVAGVLAEQSRP